MEIATFSNDNSTTLNTRTVEDIKDVQEEVTAHTHVGAKQETAVQKEEKNEPKSWKEWISSEIDNTEEIKLNEERGQNGSYTERKSSNPDINQTSTANAVNESFNERSDYKKLMNNRTELLFELIRVSKAAKESSAFRNLKLKIPSLISEKDESPLEKNVGDCEEKAAVSNSYGMPHAIQRCKINYKQQLIEPPLGHLPLEPHQTSSNGMNNFLEELSPNLKTAWDRFLKEELAKHVKDDDQLFNKSLINGVDALGKEIQSLSSIYPSLVEDNSKESNNKADEKDDVESRKSEELGSSETEYYPSFCLQSTLKESSETRTIAQNKHSAWLAKEDTSKASCTTEINERNKARPAEGNNLSTYKKVNEMQLQTSVNRSFEVKEDSHCSPKPTSPDLHSEQTSTNHFDKVEKISSSSSYPNNNAGSSTADIDCMLTKLEESIKLEKKFRENVECSLTPNLSNIENTKVTASTSCAMTNNSLLIVAATESQGVSSKTTEESESTRDTPISIISNESTTTTSVVIDATKASTYSPTTTTRRKRKAVKRKFSTSTSQNARAMIEESSIINLKDYQTQIPNSSVCENLAHLPNTSYFTSIPRHPGPRQMMLLVQPGNSQGMTLQTSSFSPVQIPRFQENSPMTVPRIGCPLPKPRQQHYPDVTALQQNKQPSPFLRNSIITPEVQIPADIARASTSLQALEGTSIMMNPQTLVLPRFGTLARVAETPSRQIHQTIIQQTPSVINKTEVRKTLPIDINFSVQASSSMINQNGGSVLRPEQINGQFPQLKVDYSNRECNSWSIVSMALSPILHVQCNCFNHNNCMQ